MPLDEKERWILEALKAHLEGKCDKAKCYFCFKPRQDDYDPDQRPTLAEMFPKPKSKEEDDKLEDDAQTVYLWDEDDEECSW